MAQIAKLHEGQVIGVERATNETPQSRLDLLFIVQKVSQIAAVLRVAPEEHGVLRVSGCKIGDRVRAVTVDARVAEMEKKVVARKKSLRVVEESQTSGLH